MLTVYVITIIEREHANAHARLQGVTSLEHACVRNVDMTSRQSSI